jgi:hypothetical protein
VIYEGLFAMVPELGVKENTLDVASARLLLSMVLACGTEDVLARWRGGALEPLFARSRGTGVSAAAETTVQEAGVIWLQQELAARDKTIASHEEGITWLRGEVTTALAKVDALRKKLDDKNTKASQLQETIKRLREEARNRRKSSFSRWFSGSKVSKGTQLVNDSHSTNRKP